MGLGHMGPGCEQQAYVAGNTQTPSYGTHHCEGPPVLPSVKGSPFKEGRTGGRPPGDGFVQAAAGWFEAEPGLRMHRLVPSTQASLGATGPTLEITGGVHKVPGLGPGNWKPSLNQTGPRVFRRTILFSRSPTPAEAECQGKTWAPGAGLGGRPRFHAR